MTQANRSPNTKNGGVNDLSKLSVAAVLAFAVLMIEMSSFVADLLVSFGSAADGDTADLLPPRFTTVGNDADSVDLAFLTVPEGESPLCEIQSDQRHRDVRRRLHPADRTR